MKTTIFFLLIFFSFTDCGNYCLNHLKPLEIKGKIINKYVNELNHATKMISIQENDYVYDIPFTDSYNLTFWEFIEIGDSIKKNKESLEITIIRRNIHNDFTFNCDF
jgi:hypothetical protein